MKLQQVTEGVILEIRVKPKSKNFDIKQNDEIVVFCRAPPTKGKANREIVRKLQKIFHKKVEIISGLKSRNKKILIKDCKIEEAQKIMEKIKGK